MLEIKISNEVIKEALLLNTLSGESKIMDIDFCGIEEDSIADDFIITFNDANLEAGIREETNSRS